MAGSAVIGSLRVNLAADSAQFSKGLKDAQSGLQKFGEMARRGLAVAAAGATVAAGALAVLVRNSINSADEMSKAAQKFGIPIEELSRLKYAADLSGVSFDQLGTGVRALSRVMHDASTGSAEAIETFSNIGVAFQNADGSLRSATEVLADISDKFAAMPDGADKTAAAMKLMGRSGADMIPLLNGGADALNKLMAEADTFGEVFTQAMGTQAENFNDNISRLRGLFTNLAGRIATDLLPHLERFSNWLVENSPQIQSFASTVLGAFIKFGEDLAQLGREINAVSTAFTDAFNTIKTGITAFVTAIVNMKDQAIAAVSAMVNAIDDWITGKLTAVWDGMTGKIDAVSNKFKALYNSVVGESYIPDMVTEIGRWMNQLQGNMVAPAAAAVDGVAGKMSELGSVGQSIASSVGAAFKGIIDGSKSARDAISGLLNDLSKLLLNSAFQTLFGGFGGSIAGASSGLLGFARGGSFRVTGAGGIDSQLVAFKATPGERVDVRRPGQASDSSGNVNVIVNTPPNTTTTTDSSRNASGGTDIRVMVENMVAESMGRSGSPINRALRIGFGNRQQLTNRGS